MFCKIWQVLRTECGNQGQGYKVRFYLDVKGVWLHHGVWRRVWWESIVAGQVFWRKLALCCLCQSSYRPWSSNNPWSSLTLPEVGEFLCLFWALSARPAQLSSDVARVAGVGMKPSSESQLHLSFENGTGHLCLIFGYFCCWFFKNIFFFRSHSAPEIRLIWNGIKCPV